MWRVHNYLLILLLTCISAYALPSDRNEKIHVLADSANYNYKTGINEFNGHVKVDQGSTHLTADKLITKSINHELHEVIAYGNERPAEYSTITKTGEPPIHAKASIIRFYPVESNVTLEKQVLVTQGKNSFQGELIHYNNLEQMITVPPTLNGRAIIIYHPNK